MLCQNIVPTDREMHASRRPPDASGCIHTDFTLPLEWVDVYAQSEWQVCYNVRSGCSSAAAVDTMPGNVYALLRPRATLYLFAIGIYQMPHTLPFMASTAMQSSRQMHRLPLHLVRHYTIFHVWYILSNLYTLKYYALTSQHSALMHHLLVTHLAAHPHTQRHHPCHHIHRHHWFLGETSIALSLPNVALIRHRVRMLLPHHLDLHCRHSRPHTGRHQSFTGQTSQGQLWPVITSCLWGSHPACRLHHLIL